jgi:hypothetical protein
MYTRNPEYTTTNRPKPNDAEKNTTAIKSNTTVIIINTEQKKHIRKKNKPRDI